MSLKDKKVDLDGYYKFWLKNRDTWLFAVIIFPLSIGLPLYFFSGVEFKGSVTLPQVMIPFLIMAVILFLIFSFDQASFKWRMSNEKNEFIDNLINGDPVPVDKATGKYRRIIIEEFKEDKVIKVRTRLGDQEIKVKDLPDHTVNISFNPIDIYNELKDE